MTMWTEEQLATYREQGFLVQRGLIPQGQIEEVRAGADELMAEQADNPPEVHVVREKSGPVRSVFCMHRSVQPFRELCRSAPIAGPIKQIFEREAYIFHSKFNYKESFEGTVWLWHQDYGYWRYDGVDDRLASALVMLGPNTRDNGCIMLVKGSHRWGVLDHYSDEVTTSYKQWCITPDALRERITDEAMIIPIEGDAGDVCFFDCRIVHGSNHNFSPAKRYSLIYAFAAIDNVPSVVENPRPDWVVARQFEPVTAGVAEPAHGVVAGIAPSSADGGSAHDVRRPVRHPRQPRSVAGGGGGAGRPAGPHRRAPDPGRPGRLQRRPRGVSGPRPADRVLLHSRQPRHGGGRHRQRPGLQRRGAGRGTACTAGCCRRPIWNGYTPFRRGRFRRPRASCCATARPRTKTCI